MEKVDLDEFYDDAVTLELDPEEFGGKEGLQNFLDTIDKAAKLEGRIYQARSKRSTKKFRSRKTTSSRR